MKKNLVACIFVAAVALVPAWQSPAATDHSLRIATFNTYMLGEGVTMPNEVCSLLFSLSDECQWVDPETPWLECVCGKHPRYDGPARQAGGHALAQRIRASGLDVIALDEVWDPEVRAILQADLSDYHYQVSYVGTSSSAIDETNDSGLMLFSKFPFIPINSNYSANTTCKVGGHGTDECIEVHMLDNGVVLDDAGVQSKFAFRRYSARSGNDAHAQKGVAYVRVISPTDGRVSNIFFTHTQGSYAPEWPEASSLADVESVIVREQQMLDFQALYLDGLASLHPGPSAINPATEDVFMMGDMNIDGDLSNSINDITATPFNNLGEWSKYYSSFGPPLSGLLTNQLWDTWVNEHPLRDTFGSSVADDFGITSDHIDCNEDASDSDGPPGFSSKRGCRWDILAHNTPLLSRKLCNQHPSVAHNLNAAGPDDSAMPPGGRGDTADGKGGPPAAGGYHSDHLGLQSDYNALAPQCSPLLSGAAAAVYGSSSYGAKTLTMSDVGNAPSGQPDFNNPGVFQLGNIANPGGVQWFYIPASMKGSYIIGLNDTGSPTLTEQGFTVQVFAPGDFSTAVKSYKDDEFPVNLRNGATGPLEPMKGKKYVFDNPPYYIKVFNRMHGTTGAYSLGVHRCNCANKDGDACVIYPNSAVATAETYQFPSGTLQSWPTTKDSMYFVFDVQQLTVPATQKIQTIVSGYTQDSLETTITTAAKTADTAVVDGTDTKRNSGWTSRVGLGDVPTGSTGYNTTCGAGTGTLGEPDFTGCNNVITWQHPQPANPVATQYLQVRRRLAGYTGAFKVHWRTEATVLRGDPAASLQCNVETNDVSERDEIMMGFTIDGMPTPYFWVSHFNAGEIQPLAGNIAMSWPTGIKAKTSIDMTLREFDDGSDEFSTPMQATMLPIQWHGPSCSYSEEENSVFGNMFDGGSYTVRYGLNHGTQQYETYSPPSATNLSQGKPASQTSTFNGRVASRANDGSTNYAVAGNSVSATTSSLNPSWQVSLGSVKTLESVWIYACTSGCMPGTQSNLYVDYWNGSIWVNKALVSAVNTPFSVVDMGGVSSAWVRIRKQETNYLELAEVKVFGY